MSQPTSHAVLNHHQCRLVVVQDQLQPCPYLDDTTARMPLRLPIGDVTPGAVDQMLELGYRRSGDFVYRTECPQCNECQPTRVDVANFVMTKSMKRVIRRGDRDLRCEFTAPVADDQRTAMFNEHRNLRKLGNQVETIDRESYRSFLVETCCDTREISIHLDDRLIAVSIIDVGTTSLSAVYTHFDPNYDRYSLGTYAILKQIEWAQQNDRRYVYLGMYVANNNHLNYKARFLPQQRLVLGTWCDFSESGHLPTSHIAIADQQQPR